MLKDIMLPIICSFSIIVGIILILTTNNCNKNNKKRAMILSFVAATGFALIWMGDVFTYNKVELTIFGIILITIVSPALATFYVEKPYHEENKTIPTKIILGMILFTCGLSFILAMIFYYFSIL